MKKLLTILFGLLSFTSFGQSINLKWKIGADEKLSYLAAMSVIDTPSIDIDLKPAQTSSDSAQNKLKRAQEIFKKLSKTLSNTDYIVNLTNKGHDIVDIAMSIKPQDDIKDPSINTTDNDDELVRTKQPRSDGMVYRGSVYATGGMHSFWVKETQKNIFSVFFELPTQAVKIGDTWKLDVHLIGIDPGFTCDSAYHVNEVKLIDIKKGQDDTIALVQYNIVEYIEGMFSIKGFMTNKGEQKMRMKFTYQALAEFSVTKGRWISYNGIMETDDTIFTGSKNKIKFALISQ